MSIWTVWQALYAERCSMAVVHLATSSCTTFAASSLHLAQKGSAEREKKKNPVCTLHLGCGQSLASITRTKPTTKCTLCVAFFYAHRFIRAHTYSLDIALHLSAMRPRVFVTNAVRWF